ncbi:HpsJ family protein [Leptolyngbya sp. KIOST-1]|uniref:HpsJ-like protein, cyanoexosortase C-associated n=1 Tax=Leptolyngbya sp. KIOST-1 TaxID=1229172 RepID=UPI000568992C|nr:HpsJ family protein [Leptolyngbya sp. KIOST-1]
MANLSNPLPKPYDVLSQRLALTIGCLCLIGFLIDILVIGFPPNPLAPQWRLNFLQQVAERSLLLLIGTVLLIYSQLENRLQSLKTLSIACLAIGLLLGLSSLLVIQDTLTLQEQAIATINTQAAELRNRIEQGQEDAALSQQISPEAFSEALQTVDSQAASLIQETQTGAMKTLISSAGNLLLMGVGLLSIGRLGLLQSLSLSQKRRFSLRQVG